MATRPKAPTMPAPTIWVAAAPALDDVADAPEAPVGVEERTRVVFPVLVEVVVLLVYRPVEAVALDTPVVKGAPVGAAVDKR